MSLFFLKVTFVTLFKKLHTLKFIKINNYEPIGYNYFNIMILDD